MKKAVAAMIVASLLITACDRVGSEAWCEKQGKKPKSDWTMGETGDYTKYCVLGMDPEKWCEKLSGKDKGEWTADEATAYAKHCVI